MMKRELLHVLLKIEYILYKEFSALNKFDSDRFRDINVVKTIYHFNFIGCP